MTTNTSIIENKEKLKALLSDVIDTDLIEECGFLDINIYRPGIIGINTHSSCIDSKTIESLNRISHITDVFNNDRDEIIIHIKSKGKEEVDQQ